MAGREQSGDLVAGLGVQPQGLESIATFAQEGRETGAVLLVREGGERVQYAFGRGEFGSVGLPAQQGEPGRRRALEPVGAYRQQQCAAVRCGEAQPGAVRFLDGGAAAAEADDVLAKQGTQDAQQQIRARSFFRRHRHGVISHCCEPRKPATARSTDSWSAPMALTTPRMSRFVWYTPCRSPS